MKVAASDYDGTLLRGGKIDEETLQAVKKWRAAGNKFGVISGRDYGMLVPQLRAFGLEFDYTVCNNGGIIRDAAENVRFQAEIEPEALRQWRRGLPVRSRPGSAPPLSRRG